jgi:large subunit ribosomal protein L3
MVPRIRFWNRGVAGLCGFAGFKAGMVRVSFVEDSLGATSGQQVTAAATIIEVPPIYVYSVTALKGTAEGGLVNAITVSATNPPKYLSRSVTPAKKSKHTLDEIKEHLTEYTELRVLAFTQPSKAGIGNKTPNPVELALGGTVEEQFNFAAEHLGKEISASKVFSPGDYVDAIAVTTGRGWQGVVARMGVALNPHKATQHRRHGGTLGGERQAKVMYTMPRAGQHGFHRRTDLNKRILAVGDAKGSASFIPSGGLKRYGKLASDYVILRGSLPGPIKRPITLRKSVRPNTVKEPPTITFM